MFALCANESVAGIDMVLSMESIDPGILLR